MAQHNPALDALRRWGQPQPDPRLQLHYLQGRRRDEAQEDLMKALKFQSERAADLENLLGLIERDLNTTEGGLRNPAMEARAAATEQAQIAGFPSSQAADEYARKIQERQLTIPLEEQEAQIAGNMRLQNLRGRQALEQLRTQQEFAERESARGRDWLERMQSGAAPIRSATVGAGQTPTRVTFGTPPQSPGLSAIQSGIRNEIGRLQVNDPRNPGSTRQLMSGVAQYLSALRLDPQTQAVFNEIVSSPEFLDPAVPASDLIEPLGDTPQDELDYQRALQILLALRGH